MRAREQFRARAGCAGFTVVELLVTLFIVVVMAVVITPSIVAARDTARVVSSERWLEDLANAIHNPDSTAGSFRVDIGRYPGALAHLSRHIQNGELNGCGREYRPGDIIPDKWRGPYVNRVVDAAGFPIGIGIVRNQLSRDDPFSVRNSILRIHVDDVHLEDAVALDARVDLSDGPAGGTVQWDPTSADVDGFMTVDYLMNVSGC